jgi:hypothetical protein
MSNQILVYLIGGVGALFGVIVVIYYMMSQKMNGKNTKYVAQLVEGTKKSSFSMDVFYQKFYVRVVRFPFIKRYALKLRRRLEILNLEDEFITRKQVAQIVFKALMIISVSRSLKLIPLLCALAAALKKNGINCSLESDFDCCIIVLINCIFFGSMSPKFCGLEL